VGHVRKLNCMLGRRILIQSSISRHIAKNTWLKLNGVPKFHLGLCLGYALEDFGCRFRTSGNLVFDVTSFALNLDFLSSESEFRKKGQSP